MKASDHHDKSGLRLKSRAGLRYLIRSASDGPKPCPVLCFLHGYDEGAPTQIQAALTRHGPLKPGAAAGAAQFLVIAPQLPGRGDLWPRYARAVHDIVSVEREANGADAGRTYLTGFSFGGNGVFDLALLNRRFWAALWTVDPTRWPSADPAAPVWLSLGECARARKREFIAALGLVSAQESPEADRVYLDEGADHVGSATRAYADERVYAWLLSKS